MSLLQFEVRCKEDTKLYDVEYNRAQNPEEFYIKVYPNNEGDCLVATMQLEPEVQLKTLVIIIIRLFFVIWYFSLYNNPNFTS